MPLRLAFLLFFELVELIFGYPKGPKDFAYPIAKSGELQTRRAASNDMSNRRADLA